MFRHSTSVLCAAILVCTAGIASSETTSQIPFQAASSNAQDASPAAIQNASSTGDQLAGETVSFLKQEEGFYPKAYGDFKQISIGYGTKALPGEKSISPQDAEARLRLEAAKVDAWIDQYIKLSLTQGQRTALTSFGYNLGTGKGGLSDLLPNIDAGNWQGVAKQMSAYTHSGGRINPGLIKRRGDEMALLFRSDEQQQAAANSVKLVTTPRPVRERIGRLAALFQARSQLEDGSARSGAAAEPSESD